MSGRLDNGSGDEQPHRYLVPVVDLVLTCEWQVGPVRFLPRGMTHALIAAQRRQNREAGMPDWYNERLDQGLAAEMDQSVVAEVTCGEPREAYSHVADALAVLRLLQHQRVPTVDTDLQTFGLPGQVAKWHVNFIDLLAGPGEGFFRGGAAPGWAFGEDDYRAFESDAGLQFLSRALAKRQRSPIEQRGILGARLLSTSTLEQDPDQKLLAAVMALEVLIGDDRRGPKKFRLARRQAFLACSVPQNSMCGRDRASCPYLGLDPDIKADADRLDELRSRAERDVRVRCSEYLRMIELYDARNRTIHDGTVGADLKTVRSSLYAIYRWLIPRVYDWYAAHPADHELRELDADIVKVVISRPAEPLPPA